MIAEIENNETEIICIAAKNQWVCAPENQLDIAKSKAKKILEKRTNLEKPATDVIITTVQPKSFDQQQGNIGPSNRDFLAKNEVESAPPVTQNPPQPNPKSTSQPNSYEHLWSYQLIGVSVLENAIKYLNKTELDKSDILIIETKRNNQDWWVVLYKLYKDKETGILDKNNLPTGINKPWLRPLKNLNVLGFVESF